MKDVPTDWLVLLLLWWRALGVFAEIVLGAASGHITNF
jgi:hypothetical protein